MCCGDYLGSQCFDRTSPDKGTFVHERTFATLPEGEGFRSAMLLTFRSKPAATVEI